MKAIVEIKDNHEGIEISDIEEALHTIFPETEFTVRELPGEQVCYKCHKPMTMTPVCCNCGVIPILDTQPIPAEKEKDWKDDLDGPIPWKTMQMLDALEQNAN